MKICMQKHAGEKSITFNELGNPEPPTGVIFDD